ncbi:hypothetical protein ACSL103130_11695 [Actinomyces slackii]|uniref:RAMA domain-containing protein n=2 Tax=Actinomyces slackii TaxID=52774 RepID=A0A448KBM5_9ACTO|nr:Uncharacterised protein [Actinomyces slackii]
MTRKGFWFMAMYELDGNHLLPVRLGRAADDDTRARSLGAVRRQIVDVLRRPLFPLEWNQIEGGESLTALDATGQVVLVEVVESLGAAEVMAAMSRLTAMAGLGRRELANRYGNGVVAFREDWSEFREAMPAQVEAGPRLTFLTTAVKADVRAGLAVLMSSGVELYEVDVRVVDEARVVVVVEQVEDGALGAGGPLLVARAPRPELTGSGSRAIDPASQASRSEPVTGPIEMVAPKQEQPQGEETVVMPVGEKGKEPAPVVASTPEAPEAHSGAARAGLLGLGRSQGRRHARSAAAEVASPGRRERAVSAVTPPEPGSEAAPAARSGQAPSVTAASAKNTVSTGSAVSAGSAGSTGSAARTEPRTGAATEVKTPGRSASAEGAEGAAREAVPPRTAPGRRAHSAGAARQEAVVTHGAHAAMPVPAPATDAERADGAGDRAAARAAGARASEPQGPGIAPVQVLGTPSGSPVSVTRVTPRQGAGVWDQRPDEEQVGVEDAENRAAAGKPTPGSAQAAADLAAIAAGFERPKRIIWQGLRRGIYHEATLSSKGVIALVDGRTFTDPSAAANAAQGVDDADGWRVWRLGVRGPQLGELREALPERE